MTEEYITLKWGTLKAWNFTRKETLELFDQYCALGTSAGAMMQHDTQEQKAIICRLIDECDADTIELDWEEKSVSKDEAKQYVMTYRTDR